MAWKVEVPGRGWSSPVLSKGRLYLTSAVPDAGGSDITLHALCLDAADGRVIWDKEVLRPDPSRVAAMHRKKLARERLGGNFSSSPIAVDGRVYFQNETGVGYVVKAGQTYELLATNNLGARSLASYAVADGALYIRAEAHLWKISR